MDIGDPQRRGGDPVGEAGIYGGNDPQVPAGSAFKLLLTV